MGGEAPHLRRAKPMWSISPHAVTDDSGIIDLKFYLKIVKQSISVQYNVVNHVKVKASCNSLVVFSTKI